MTEGHYIYCALCFFYYYISSTTNHQAKDPGGCRHHQEELSERDRLSHPNMFIIQRSRSQNSINDYLLSDHDLGTLQFPLCCYCSVLVQNSDMWPHIGAKKTGKCNLQATQKSHFTLEERELPYGGTTGSPLLCILTATPPTQAVCILCQSSQNSLT